MTTQLPRSFTLNSTPYPTRKRRAQTPPVTDAESSKRRRPNLTHGFSSLSIEPLTAPWAEDDGDDDDSPFHIPIESPQDVCVEELPDARHRQFAPPSSDSDEGYDGTFHLPPSRHHRHARVAQQPDEIQLPLEPPVLPLDYEDVTERPTRGTKRQESFDMSRPKRPRNDMSMDEENHQRHTEWYEPEKDRIVITSLGSPSSSRSSSPDRPRRLAQPGEQGFTLNPSFLTHLINSQKDRFTQKPNAQQSLVLYRRPPVWPDVVRHWQIEDPGRFEEVDDDEDLSMLEAVEGSSSHDGSTTKQDMDGDISME